MWRQHLSIKVFKVILPGCLRGLQLVLYNLAVYSSYNLLQRPGLGRLGEKEKKQIKLVHVEDYL